MTDKRPWPTRPMFVDENPNKRDGADVGRYVIVIDDSMQRYAAYTTTGVQEHEEEAIARLMAAAPQMYEALDWLMKADVDDAEEACNAARAALRAANPDAFESEVE